MATREVHRPFQEPGFTAGFARTAGRAKSGMQRNPNPADAHTNREVTRSAPLGVKEEAGRDFTSTWSNKEPFPASGPRFTCAPSLVGMCFFLLFRMMITMVMMIMMCVRVWWGCLWVNGPSPNNVFRDTPCEHFLSVANTRCAVWS